jgi:hypothetical protein
MQTDINKEGKKNTALNKILEMKWQK